LFSGYSVAVESDSSFTSGLAVAALAEITLFLFWRLFCCS
jgi:hypothetical protein